VEQRRISSGSEFEQRWGYSRAVVSGSSVHVAGTAPIMADGADPPAGAYAQMRRCLEIVERALDEAGTSLSNVVRTRVFVTDPSHVADAMRAHGEAFAEVRPACTGIIARLFDDRWLVEIEVEAVLP
jgi:enamine deaminase RidA (YjgF/YER057c/UK114 family)